MSSGFQRGFTSLTPLPRHSSDPAAAVEHVDGQRRVFDVAHLICAPAAAAVPPGTGRASHTVRTSGTTRTIRRGRPNRRQVTSFRVSEVRLGTTYMSGLIAARQSSGDELAGDRDRDALVQERVVGHVLASEGEGSQPGEVRFAVVVVGHRLWGDRLRDERRCQQRARHLKRPGHRRTSCTDESGGPALSTP